MMVLGLGLGGAVLSSSPVCWGPHTNLTTRTKLGSKLVVVQASTEEASVVVNPSIKKDVDKVVDTVVVGELSKPLTPYCRCWRSKTFPLCDASHVKHNKATGDNVGPLLVKK